MKQRCEDMYAVDLANLARAGALHLFRRGTFGWTVNGHQMGSVRFIVLPDLLRLSYAAAARDEWCDVNEDIPFAWSETRFGGRRRWFVCPDCQRRCRIVYAGDRFRCRTCLQLAYSSQYEPSWQRVLTRAQNLRMRLGGPPAVDEPFPPKPKGMHRRTYERLVAEDNRARAVWLQALRGRFLGSHL